jgi:thiamine phosphate synthase YjbQ (UPF0047 family)
MAENPPDANNIPLPVYRKDVVSVVDQNSPDDDGKPSVGHHEMPLKAEENTNLHRKAAISVIQQQHTIPVTGSRKPTGKWEYIFFCIFCTPKTLSDPSRMFLVTDNLHSEQISQTMELVSLLQARG